MQSWKKEEKESVSLTWYREYIDVKNKEYSDRQLLMPKRRFIIEIEVLERTTISTDSAFLRASLFITTAPLSHRPDPLPILTLVTFKCFR